MCNHRLPLHTSVHVHCSESIYIVFQIFDIAALVTGEEFFDHFTYILQGISPDNGYLELDPVTGMSNVSEAIFLYCYPYCPSCPTSAIQWRG